MLVFGICGVLAAGAVDAVMRNFAGEAGVPPWVFVIVPGLFAMLFALIGYRNAHANVAGVNQSLSRALLIALTSGGRGRICERAMVPRLPSTEFVRAMWRS